MRFNPGQFNPYYLAGLLLVSTALVVSLTSRTPSIVPIESVEAAPALSSPATPQELATPDNSRREKRERKEKREAAPVKRTESEPDQETGLMNASETADSIPEQIIEGKLDTLSASQSIPEQELPEEAALIIPLEIDAIPEESEQSTTASDEHQNG